MHAIRTRIARAIQELPAVPAVVIRVLRETTNENVSAGELEKLLAADQALSAKALRVVNSAYYGMSRQIESLSQAVVILGIQQLRNLVLSLSAMSMIKPQTTAQKEIHRRFWIHSVASANAAQALARAKKLSTADQELAYIAGLLHDVGRLFLFTNFMETYMEIERRSGEGEPLDRVEKQNLGLTHAQVGQVLAHVWRFPERLGGLMGEHDGPFDGNSQPLAMVLHLAHCSANAILWRTPIETFAQTEPLLWMGWQPEDWAGFCQDMERKIVAYEGLYGTLAA